MARNLLCHAAEGYVKSTIATSSERETREREFTKMLEVRRQSLIDDVQGRMREARTAPETSGAGIDESERSELDFQDDVNFALLQMKADTLVMIDAALTRLRSGMYGDCTECDQPIAEARLRALPFAVRCKDCAEAQEEADARNRPLVDRRPLTAPFWRESAQGQ
jgi:DnaK suppressor protein